MGSGECVSCQLASFPKISNFVERITYSNFLKHFGTSEYFDKILHKLDSTIEAPWGSITIWHNVFTPTYVFERTEFSYHTGVCISIAVNQLNGFPEVLEVIQFTPSDSFIIAIYHIHLI